MTDTLDRLFPAASGRNRFVDPSMRVSQQSGSAALALANAAPVYPSDSIIAYRVGATGGATAQRVNEQGAAASPNRVRLTVTGANANLGANDSLQLVTRIEGLDVSDLKWGTTAARPIIIRFGVRCSVAGSYAVCVGNTNLTRLYPASFTIAPGEVGIDVVKSLVVPGDTAGTWATDTQIGLQVLWLPCLHSQFLGPAGWNTGQYLGPVGASNIMATNGATFDLFDIALHDTPSLTATTPPAYVLRPADEDFDKCLRYYQIGELRGPIGGNNSAGAYSPNYTGMTNQLPIQMRVAPTTTFTDSAGTPGVFSTASLGNGATLGAGGVTSNGKQVVVDAILNSTNGGSWFYTIYRLNARL